MAYHMDFKNITLDDYKEMLINSNLIKSRMCLLEDIDENFNIIKSRNILNLATLSNELKNNQKIKAFSMATKVDETYLKVLIREIKSNQPKPVKFSDFPNVSDELSGKMLKLNIKHTKDFYDRFYDNEDNPNRFSNIEISHEEEQKLKALTNLVRIRWVNHTFSYVLYTMGFKKAEEVAGADYIKLYEDIIKANEGNVLYKGRIGKNDIKILVQAAKHVKEEIRSD